MKISAAVAHVVAARVVLGGVDVRRHDALLLDPEPIDVVLESQTGREEGREAVRVVVGGDSAIHPPVPVRDGRPEVDQDIEVVDAVRVDLVLIREKQVDEVDGVDVVRSRSKGLRDPDDRAVGYGSALQQERILEGGPRRDVGFQVHRRIDEQLAALVVFGNLRDGFAEYVLECGDHVEGLVDVVSAAGLVQPSAGDLVLLQGFGAVLHERVRTHIVVRADDETAWCT